MLNQKKRHKQIMFHSNIKLLVIVILAIVGIVLISKYSYDNGYESGFDKGSLDSSGVRTVSLKDGSNSKLRCNDIVSDLQQGQVSNKYSGDIAPVNFNSLPDARLFKTSITNSYKDGPNFAGHYHIAMWGCGTDCFGLAVIDVISGNIVGYSPTNESYHLGNYDLSSQVVTFSPVYAGMDRIYFMPREMRNGIKQFESVCVEKSTEDLFSFPE